MGSSSVASAYGVPSLTSLKMEEVAEVGVVGEWYAPGKVLVRDMLVRDMSQAGFLPVRHLVTSRSRMALLS